jgi:ribosome-binding protein aMBF1 (putative translation factor)
MTYQVVDSKALSVQPPIVIDWNQIRMARAGLGWSAKELADRASLGVATIRRAESDYLTVSPGNLFVIQHALEDAGVVFLEEDQASTGGGRGVRLAKRGTSDDE